MSGACLAFAATAAALLLAGCSNLSEGVNTSSIVSTHGEKVAPNHWTVSPSVFASNGENEALYQAAVLAKANGYPYFQIVDYDDGVAGSAKYHIAGANAADTPLECAASEYEKFHCRTENTDETLSKIGWKLGKTPARIAAEVNTARLTKAAP